MNVVLIEKESSELALAILMAGSTAPKRFPKWGVPVDCTPVKIRAIFNYFGKGTFPQRGAQLCL